VLVDVDDEDARRHAGFSGRLAAISRVVDGQLTAQRQLRDEDIANVLTVASRSLLGASFIL